MYRTRLTTAEAYSRIRNGMTRRQVEQWLKPSFSQFGVRAGQPDEWYFKALADGPDYIGVIYSNDVVAKTEWVGYDEFRKRRTGFGEWLEMSK
jgi:hypothetical protein